MAKFNYSGIDRYGRPISGSTAGTSEQEVRDQLVEFGFTNIRVEAEVQSPTHRERSERPDEQTPEDFVQKLVDGDIEVGEPVSEEDEWYRAEALARIRRYRRRENIALVVTLIVVGVAAAYFVYDRITHIPAPQPQILTRSGSELLSFKDVYVKGEDLVFVVFSRNWNGNVRVDFQAWDAFDNKIDFGTARLGFIGEHFGGSPEKSGTFKLKKTKFYEKIEILVSGDEGK
ncbi:MAG: hypothetical protein JSV16_14730 [Candidatus Hydrogenedentota bacterium]|nr:MAG: hypothetical protein JSV16_14730 [Candidatus Hydrogenedentota bacterium]